MNIHEYRLKHPEYDAIDDETLSKAMYNKFYASRISYEQFAEVFLTPKEFRSDAEIPKADEAGLPPRPKEQPDHSISDRAYGVFETGKAMVTGGTAGTVGYIAGVLKQFAEEVYTGEAFSDEANERVEQKAMEWAEMLTDTPDTPLGQEYTENVGEALAPLAAVAPQLMSSQTAGFGSRVRGGNTKPLSNSPKKAIQQAAPNKDTLRGLADSLYTELENTGVRIKPSAYDKFADLLAGQLKRLGIDKDVTPKAYAALNRILEEKGSPKTLRDIETLRRVARGAANSIEKQEQMLGSAIIDAIDIAVDGASNVIGGKYKQARDVYGRVMKSQDMEDMMQRAQHQASGFENGLRIEVRSLLKNKKRLKFYNKEEIKALRQIEQGTTAANTAKLLGKFGVSENQAAQLIGGVLGGTLGYQLGAVMGGGYGAAMGMFGLPAIGQIAKKTAQRLTLDNTKYAEALTRSGKDGLAITKAYFKHTPKGKRNVSDLTQLLLGADLKKLKVLGRTKEEKKMVADAKYFAEQIYGKTQEAGAVAAIAGIEEI